MTTRIRESLTALFAEQRFAFWHDSESQFAADVAALSLPDVTLVRVDATPALEIKMAVQLAAPDSKWLFYSNMDEPAPEHDWLLDIRMRGQAFYADTTSILLADLGLATLSLREHLKARSKFLAAKDRVARLKKLVLPQDEQSDLERKMVAVIVRADPPDFAAILLRLFTAMEQNGIVNLDTDSKIWTELASYELVPAFWQMAQQELAYAEEAPSLRDLLFRMFVTDLARGMSASLPASLQHFMLTDQVKAASASVFLSQWRSNIAHFASYNAISASVADQLQLAQAISQLHAEDLMEAMTFAEVEKIIITDLRDRILSGGGALLDAVHSVVASRRDGHWANPKLAANNDMTRALVCCYQALEAGADLFQLRHLHQAGFSFTDAHQATQRYEKELFRFDQSYRHFHHAANQVEPMGWALLHSLRDQVEALYSDWFVPQLALAWGKILEGDAGLLRQWQVPGKINQQQFFSRNVAPLLGGAVKRVFVIISDAFRFEAAEELYGEILNRNRFQASLDCMLGVLPSYTALGMAALLPHKTLAYKVGATVDVQVDGLPTASTEQRDAILSRHGGMAIKWEDLMALGKDKGRECVKDASIVYVYHDRIDMLGDKGASETKTFEAVKDTIGELNDLLGFIINTLNASTVLVTADHGFMYQDSALDAADKSTIDVKPEGVLKSKKRYILGQHLGATDKTWHGSTQATAGTTPDGSLEFWVPKGATRFHFAGGARFVHGSAMPQEIIVPILTVKVSDTDKAKISSVNIAALMMTQKVVTNMQRFEFIQTEPVSDKVLARTVSISLRDGETMISNEQIATFDSPSSSMDERKKSVMITVMAGSYDRTKDYYLVVRDVATKLELYRTPLKIDLALANDF